MLDVAVQILWVHETSGGGTEHVVVDTIGPKMVGTQSTDLGQQFLAKANDEVVASATAKDAGGNLQHVYIRPAKHDEL